MPRRSTDRAALLASVASRLAHAMHESHGPVERMGEALERMMRALARSARALERLRAAERDPPQAADPAALEDLEGCREALEREIAACIESLQFHDRLMQQLAHVRGGLAALAGAAHGALPEARKPDVAAGSVELF